MIRTQIQLPESDYERLRQMALQQRRSMADCIRDGIRWVLAQPSASDVGLAAIAGKFPPRPLDDLKRHDQDWAEAIAGSRKRK
jgi:hypothetical protein